MSKVVGGVDANPLHGESTQDNGDGEGPNDATAWGTEGAADGFTTFMDGKSYTSKMSSDTTEARGQQKEGERGERERSLLSTLHSIESDI